jgi:hypothetical protein
MWEKNNEMALCYIKVACETNPSDIDSKNLMEKIYNEIVDKQL